MTEHDRTMLLRAADGVAKHEDLTGLAAIIRRVVERQPATAEPVAEVQYDDDTNRPIRTPDTSPAAVITGPDKRIKHLTDLLSEAIAFIETPAPELGSDEWVWLIQASAAFHNQCVKCSSPCDEEGDCVSPECCFGRSKLAASALCTPAAG